jgi:hypothetical protein
MLAYFFPGIVSSVRVRPHHHRLAATPARIPDRGANRQPCPRLGAHLRAAQRPQRPVGDLGTGAGADRVVVGVEEPQVRLDQECRPAERDQDVRVVVVRPHVRSLVARGHQPHLGEAGADGRHDLARREVGRVGHPVGQGEGEAVADGLLDRQRPGDAERERTAAEGLGRPRVPLDVAGGALAVRRQHHPPAVFDRHDAGHAASRPNPTAAAIDRATRRIAATSPAGDGAGRSGVAGRMPSWYLSLSATTTASTSSVTTFSQWQRQL